IVPNLWKISRVCPIPKKDSNEFRPISILSNCSKIMESIVNSSLIEHLKKINYFNERQFGFRKNHSTQCAALAIQHFIAKNLDDKKFCALISIDFSKAFDTIDRQILLDKLFFIGVTDKAYTWFSSYLKCRKQFIKANGKKSKFAYNNLGVPQGSILGPILFEIYLMDIFNLPLHGTLIGYADDLYLMISGSSCDDLNHKANQDLKLIKSWVTRNKMIMNKQKCSFILFSGKKETKQIELLIGDYKIRQSNQIKVLGIIFDEKFNFQMHIDGISQKIKRNLGLLYRIRNNLKDDGL
ncbi:RNA-directed DNA polymerase from mobile element jockey-like protein, partial [Dinothrombium tinctorium]